jgi:hypothetical protein
MNKVDNMNMSESSVGRKSKRSTADINSRPAYPARPDSKAEAKARRRMIGLLIRLAENDADALLKPEAEGDLLNFARDMVESGMRTPLKHAADMEKMEEVSVDVEMKRLAVWLRANPDQLKAGISSLRKVLTAAADSLIYEWTFAAGASMILDGRRLKAGYSALRWFVPTPQTLSQMISINAILLLVRGDEGAMVRRCAYSRCMRIFLAARPKQTFCSRKCVNADNFVRYKQAMGVKAYNRKHRKVARESARRKAAEARAQG